MGIELDGAHGVIVSGNQIVHIICGRVGVDDRYHGNAQLRSLFDRNLLVTHVHHKQRVGKRWHLLDTAQAALQFVHFAFQPQHLFLGQGLRTFTAGQLLQLPQPFDGLTNSLEIGEGTAQPAIAHIGHPRALSLGLDRVPGCPLGTHKQHGTAFRNGLADKLGGLLKQRHRLFQVDDVDLVSFAEDEGSHLRVPEAGLMTKMHASLQHLAHGYVGHDYSLSGFSLRTSRSATTRAPG